MYWNIVYHLKLLNYVVFFRLTNCKMEQKHKHVLQRQRTYIIHNIRDVSNILDHLFAASILDDDLMDEIKAGRTPRERKQTLLNILPSRGGDAYSVFCEALVQEGYEFVALGLKEAEADAEEANTALKSGCRLALCNIVIIHNVL